MKINKLIINKQITKNIIHKFSIIVLLNISDMILTYIGITTSYCLEANKLMLPVVDNLIVLSLLKILLPTCLFTFIYFRMSDATIEQIKRSYKLINGLIIYYVVVNVINIGSLVIGILSRTLLY